MCDFHDKISFILFFLYDEKVLIQPEKIPVLFRQDHNDMKTIKTVLITTALLATSPLFANTAVNASANAEVKTGEQGVLHSITSGVSNTAHKAGEGIQHTAEKVDQGVAVGVDKTRSTSKKVWDGTKTFTEETTDAVKDKAEDAKDFTVEKTKDTKSYVGGKTDKVKSFSKEKWQKTKDALTPASGSTGIQGGAQAEVSTPVAKASVGTNVEASTAQ